jgi:nicotinamide mononucleotide transporter
VIATLLEGARPALAPAFTLWGAPVTWLEIAAFGLSLGMVAANIRVRPVAWPLAVVAALLYALLFADSRLYGQALLQLFFVAVAAWGWWQWVRGRGADGGTLVVHRLTARGRLAAGLGTALAWPALALALAHGTDSPAPWADALATAASVTGQLLLGRKVLENWPVWLAVNVFSVGLFAARELWLTALLYALFAALSVMGWRAWRARLAADG